MVRNQCAVNSDQEHPLKRECEAAFCSSKFRHIFKSTYYHTKVWTFKVPLLSFHSKLES